MPSQLQKKIRREEWFLVPKIGKPKNQKIAVFDVEANNWIDFEFLGFYDGQNYLEFHSIESFVNFVLTKRYRSTKIYAHFGGKYDFLFLLEHFKNKRPDLHFTTVLQGSKIILLKVKHNKNTWSFCDSSALFPGMSLEKLCKSFQTSTQKMSGAIDFEKERVSKKNKLHRQYLKADCLSLFECIEKFSQDPKIREDGLKLTLASQAMSIWRRTLKQSFKVPPQGVQNFVRQSYTGGRVEIFKMKGEGLNLYDVNSLFPYCMRNFDLPMEFRRDTRRLSNRLSFLDCTVLVPHSFIPILPYRDPDSKKLIFPTGTFRGVFFSKELKLAIEQGAKILKIHNGKEFFTERGLFNEYIDYFFDQKNNSKKGSASYLVAKLLQNSLYGKFGAREERSTLKTWEGFEKCFKKPWGEEKFHENFLIEVVEKYRSPFMQVQIASAITSYARIHMAKTCYLPLGEKTFYTDTDSVFTPYLFKTSENLGGLKLEYSDFEGFFKLPKTYLLTQNNERILAKAKGFSEKYIKTLNNADFKSGKFNENALRPLTMKRAIANSGNYLVRANITRTLQSVYDKRRVLKYGNTEPWQIKNGLIINSK